MKLKHYLLLCSHRRECLPAPWLSNNTGKDLAVHESKDGYWTFAAKIILSNTVCVSTVTVPADYGMQWLTWGWWHVVGELWVKPLSDWFQMKFGMYGKKSDCKATMVMPKTGVVGKDKRESKCARTNGFIAFIDWLEKIETIVTCAQTWTVRLGCQIISMHKATPEDKNPGLFLLLTI